MAECKSCKQKILWVVTEKGKNMPVNADPITIFVNEPGKDVYKMALGFVPHWATCPHADMHRKKHGTQKNTA